MKIAVDGLGKMGRQIARKLHENGFTVIAHGLQGGAVDEMKTLGMLGASTKEEVLSSFAGERVIIWIMMPADLVDAEVEMWLKILPPNSVIIDGGNSNFKISKVRAQQLQGKSSSFLDVGTSGGVWGYKNGFSLMVGGEEKVFKELEPVFGALAKPEGAYTYFGESGSGHFVKMVHNAIEYGMMESLGEGYRLLKEGPYKNIDLAKVADLWQHHSVVTSWLNELTRDILKENPELKGIDGYVAESGETRWALETAKEHLIEMPAVKAAFDVRMFSQKGLMNFTTKLVSAMRNAFSGQNINKE